MSRLLALVVTSCLVLLLCPCAYGAEVKVEGILKAVDVKERTLTVDRKTASGVKKLSLDVADEVGDLTALRVGDKVSFSYDSTLELVTKIFRPAADVPGGGRTASSEKTVCRVTLHVASDGTTSGRVELAPDEPVSDDGIGVPKKVADRMWRVVHAFPNEASCKPYQKQMDRKMAHYSRLHRALVLPPTDMSNGWATLSFPCLVRLPVTVVADVEAVGAGAQVAVALNGPPTQMSTAKSIETKVVTENAFKTNEFSGVFRTRALKQGQTPTAEEVFVERGFELKKGSGFRDERDPTMDFSPTSQWNATLSSFIGPEKKCQGVRLRRFEVTGRLAPGLGVQMKEDGDKTLISEVVPDTLANKSGLKAGDRLMSVGGKQVSGLAQAMQLLQLTEFGDTWDLEIVRDGSKKTFSIKSELP